MNYDEYLELFLQGNFNNISEHFIHNYKHCPYYNCGKIANFLMINKLSTKSLSVRTRCADHIDEILNVILTYKLQNNIFDVSNNELKEINNKLKKIILLV